MADIPIYLGYPNIVKHPVAQDWAAEIRCVLQSDPDWVEWALKEYEYDINCALDVNDLVSVVKSEKGPCVLIRPIQQRVFEALRSKLSGRSIVLIGAPDDAVDMLTLLENGRDMHLSGEPMLPQKLVVALLLIAKLEKHQMWGGNNKGYMWASDLAKGRGLDERFAGRVSDVILDLGLHDFLIRKTSQRRPKYGLNPEKRSEIFDALRSRTFPEEIRNRFMVDERLESARELDLFNEEGYVLGR